MLWRSGLRISEALALNETDLDPERGSLLVRHGKGDKPREVGMDRWAWAQLGSWLELRREPPVGRLFCIVRGPTSGRPCASAGIRAQLHHAATIAGVRRRFAPHQLRHAHAVEMAHEGVPLVIIQRQLGHATLGITSIVVSHDVKEISTVADQVILLSGGKVVAHGTPSELKTNPSDVVRQFVGGLADGPVPFHYPAPDYFGELLAAGEDY